ncbi:MAG: hypothetical protein KGH87_00640 [Thaumarchaeota archaeon]|nr:hypothetical protein [Candidatus Nitrosotalea sp.]MDE1813246.1 hypothetical protein [Nitrososphaerota archaeon]MDE1838403.1 hypothetical protein [Nitrososphaerota archaeon]
MKTIHLLTITAWAVLLAFLSLIMPAQAQEWKSITVNAPPSSLTQSGQNFNIQYSVVNGTGVLQENHYMFTANVRADTSGTFEIKIPRNFPYYNGKDGPSETETYAIIKDGIQLKSGQYDKRVSDCSYDYSVPFSQRSTIIVTSTDELLLMTPIYGDRVTSDCTPGAMVPSQASVIRALCLQSFDHGPTFGETIGKQQCENPQSQIIYKDANLTVTNIMGKNMFKAGENITVIPELTNAANHNVTIGYCGPLFVTLVVDQYGKLVSPQYSWACPLVGYSMNVAPNSSTPGESYGQNIVLHTPGNYTVMSIVSFGDTSKQIILWSKPVQITILPEKVPEFPFAQIMLAFGIVSTLIIYRKRK